ncbi:hypothetical protein CLAFUW4_00928 [Fulvia fulva]|uniref:Uncharacterized protein n=1 Tax=Passalora fulva TaxID=5499 RepID=A0A9Q8L698_PASFU|nr:uncharacterized protein CLAFUR5_00933 [Fulvia fulva]KAK4634806.1 hypothetical protein CLAFUR4_00929 [Fulvia fulva]KAK4638579.1 hypothetical protein CLAFUR0_00929 [Fulvia fulva]UJO11598.1 hypothetical protein CLAFUR5_00933 [Fulvia fulva]WPV09439.1 hypothetical protein CLAFUW4_00928 [Fulvia fulva]WPV24018.1 hypothetical protein CLAFUW7_00888 [Fulvia fulva]
MLFRVARTITKERTWWFPRHFFRMFPNIHINSTTIRTSSSSKEKQIFNMALRMALCVLFLAASMATLSVADDQSCAKFCNKKYPRTGTMDSLDAAVHCLTTCNLAEGPSQRETHTDNSTVSASQDGQAAPKLPHKANGTHGVRPTAVGLSATLLPTPPYSPVTFLPNNTKTNMAAQDAGVGASGMAALLGVAALWNVL